MNEKLEQLQVEIEEARRKIRTDVLSMSIGEILNKLENDEIILNPKFQRYFRWTERQKSDLIESIFMALPIPPIFVFTNNQGKWEVIDGLQRLTTIHKFYKNEFALTDCSYIKSGKDLFYKNLSEKQQLLIKNKRLDFIILDETSDGNAKYDMFNRLNTGGSALSDQEVRNCIMIMKNEKFFDWFKSLEDNEYFRLTITEQFSERQIEEQKDLELILKFLAIRNIKDSQISFNDSKEFLDKQAIEMCDNSEYDKEVNKTAFNNTFTLLNEALGENAFKRYDYNKNKFVGPINFFIYEFLISGIGTNILDWDNNIKNNIKSNLKNKLIELYNTQRFKELNKIGNTVSTRLKNAIDYSKEIFDRNGFR